MPVQLFTLPPKDWSVHQTHLAPHQPDRKKIKTLFSFLISIWLYTGPERMRVVVCISVCICVHFVGEMPVCLRAFGVWARWVWRWRQLLASVPCFDVRKLKKTKNRHKWQMAILVALRCCSPLACIKTFFFCSFSLTVLLSLPLKVVELGFLLKHGQWFIMRK